MVALIGLRGITAQVLKIAIVGFFNAVAIAVVVQATARGSYVLAAACAIILLIFDWVYFSRRLVPLKFLLPGMLLTSVFVITPVLYTVVVSGMNYGTGNLLSKPAAIEALLDQGMVDDPDGVTYDMVLGRDASGSLAALLTDQVEGIFFLATEETVKELTSADVVLDEFGVASGNPGFTALTEEEKADLDESISSLRFPLADGALARAEGADIAVKQTVGLTYDPVRDVIRDLNSDAEYADNGRGNFANVNDPEEVIFPGWRSFIGPGHYAQLFVDERLRGPFISIFIWTVSFAALSVLTTFALGLLIALILNRNFAGRRIYRSVFILPYAIPSFMSILVWAGLLNRDFGVVNRVLGMDIRWLEDPTLAKASILLVNLWLGFPYMMLITMGALQAIPSELTEAAAIDGASSRQAFWKITLPLLLGIVTPLLIASFAFNFNNFNIIYLLTAGGPTRYEEGEIGGATDILISLTYKTAFTSETANYGLASAYSVIIFFIVAGISLYTIRRSRVLEEQ
jgi:arabinogalactan oligomer / maltooligosaccharide transport system permease protein